MKSIKLFVVVCVALIVGASFNNSVVAQSNDGLVNQFVETYFRQNESELLKAGVVSSDARLEDSVLVCTLLFDEAVATADMIGAVLDVAREKSNTPGLFSEVDKKVIRMFESQGLSCRCVIHGNNSPKEVVRDLSVCEFLAFEKFLSGDKAATGEPSIDDIVAMIDNTLAGGDMKIRCVRRGELVCLEQETTASEYDDIKTAMETCGGLIRTMMKKALTRDKKIADLFRFIAKKGYRFAYSVHCGDNEPVIIELNF